MEKKSIRVNGYNVKYLEAGNSKSKRIICLHGLGASAGRWAKVLPILSKKYHVIAPDIVGFGYSDKPEVYYTIPFFVDFVKGFTDALDIDKFVLMGASLGGHIAVEASLAYDHVEKLVLVSPAGIMKDPTPALNHYIAAAMYPTFENAKKAFQEMGARKDVDEDYTRDFVERMQLRNAKYAFMSAVMGSKAAPNLLEKLHEIEVPTLIVWGKKDPLIPYTFARQFHKNIRNSKLVILERCGHVPYFEKPERFCGVVMDFLKK